MKYSVITAIAIMAFATITEAGIYGQSASSSSASSSASASAPAILAVPAETQVYEAPVAVVTTPVLIGQYGSLSVCGPGGCSRRPRHESVTTTTRSSTCTSGCCGDSRSSSRSFSRSHVRVRRHR